jgi:pSer/pThr/pTyr-binding forkhead associated (FHA) protein
MQHGFKKCSSLTKYNFTPQNQKMSTIDDLETRLQTLLEIQLIKYLPGYKVEDLVYQQLATAMQNNLTEQNGTTFAPNNYVLIAHPLILVHWNSEPRLLLDMADAIQTAAKEKGFHFLADPIVSTAEDPNMIGETIRVISSFSNIDSGETRGKTIGFHTDNEERNIPANAFLVMDGNKIIPLDTPVLNIGRRLNNQIIINDKRISRTHAQLRVSKGRFALFDLNSTGGTFVNGRRINQSTLFPGDVISLAGVTLIYGQDAPVGPSTLKVIAVPKSDEPSGDSSENYLPPRIISGKKSKHS